MSNNESMEMYLETIFILENDHGHAHSVEIAKKLGVSKPSVSKAMNSLKEQGLIVKETYGSINLTDKGRDISMKISKKHELIETFLKDTLGLSSVQASKDACRIEHVASEEMFEAIEQYLVSNS